jgi:hypothetical protein
VNSEAVPIGSPVTMAADLRRVSVLAACLGAAGVVVMILVGRPWMGAFAVLGLGLGLLNAVLVRRSAARFASTDSPRKASFAASALGRLALITVLALGFALIVRPDGLGVFIGLAAFQLLMIGVGLVPLLKEIRSSEGLGK